MKLKMLGNERGAVLVVVAISMVALLSMVALAVDLGMLFKTRDEAQRAADAAALAGASAFLEQTGLAAVDTAEARAYDFALRNNMTGGPIDSSEVTVVVIPDSQKVRVWIRRASVATWFARVFGVTSVPIGAKSAAWATAAGQGKCVKPFAIPDMWNETNHDPPPQQNKPGQDVDNDKIWDQNEAWNFEPSAGDTYRQWDGTDLWPDATGYGSGWRNNIDGGVNDYGRTLTIKAQSPGDALAPGFFYPYRIGESSGAQDYKANIYGCNPSVVELGTPYDIENGNMVGPTHQGIDSLMALDPGAIWDPTIPIGGGKYGTVTGSSYGNWLDSPRVIPVGLFDPQQIADIQGAGGLSITFNNIALMFLEGFVGNGNQAPVQSRFLYFAAGSGPGPVAGPLVKFLQLVE